MGGALNRQITVIQILAQHINADHFSRFIWFVCTIGAIGLFMWLFAIRLHLLVKEHPKTVNVEVTYGDKLPFPSVTICNQNFFR